MQAGAQASVRSGGLNPSIRARVIAVRNETADTRILEFQAIDGSILPPCTPGAHIDVELPGGLVRQYSLLQAGEQLSSYAIAVKREQNGRGGSRQLHDQVRVGEELTISAPRNHFPLNEAASHSVLIAGGIGITPILCMAERLAERGVSFELHYACRDAGQAAFLENVRGYARATFYSDAERGGPPPLEEIVSSAPAGAELYCCGPGPMLDAFEREVAKRGDIKGHVERFTAAHEAAKEGGFVVRLARSNRELRIKKGQSILQALLEAGFDLPHSCEEGVCGSCETRVVSGTPDHRDSLLSERERAANKVMMICCSGALSHELVLDL
ncbi:MAG TPA: PDR/VanB family oxidoreductase [Terricaulis sp.]|nr:PDR/VanB family oxidoreductase [Terricaulis sp.]